jgi:hypothetical protein
MPHHPNISQMRTQYSGRLETVFLAGIRDMVASIAVVDLLKLDRT